MAARGIAVSGRCRGWMSFGVMVFLILGIMIPVCVAQAKTPNGSQCNSGDPDDPLALNATAPLKQRFEDIQNGVPAALTKAKIAADRDSKYCLSGICELNPKTGNRICVATANPSVYGSPPASGAKPASPGGGAGAGSGNNESKKGGVEGVKPTSLVIIFASFLALF